MDDAPRREQDQPAGEALANGGDRSPAEELKTSVHEGLPVKREGGQACVEGHLWGQERELPAALLYELLARSKEDVEVRAVVLVGLRITGRLNLQDVELQAPLIVHNCYFDHPVNLALAKASEICLTACHLPGLAADGLETRGDLDLSRATLELIDLRGAHIGGGLVLEGVTLTGADWPLDLKDGTLLPHESRTGSLLPNVAVMADGLRVDRRISCREVEKQPFTAEGEVRLLDAHIGGSLDFGGATLASVALEDARIGASLSFDGARLAGGLNAAWLQVEGDMWCLESEKQPFTAEGEVVLLEARIGRSLYFDGATLAKGLNATELEVNGDMRCSEGEKQPFEAQDKVSLNRARVGGKLYFYGATLAKGLNATELEVNGDMRCGEGEKQPFEAQGSVFLVSARVGGALDFSGAKLTEVSLAGARIGGATFDGATLSNDMGCALDGIGLTVEWTLSCAAKGDQRFSATGGVGLRGAHIGRGLVFSGARLSNSTDGDALDARYLRVDGNMFCDAIQDTNQPLANVPFEAYGTVSLVAAHVGGQLSFKSATLRSPGGVALLANQLKVDQTLFCDAMPDSDHPLAGKPFEAEGAVSLEGAYIEHLSFASARLNNPDGLALNAAHLRVNQAMNCGPMVQDGHPLAKRPFDADGEVSLSGAHIGKFVIFTGARLKNPGKDALDAYGLRVDGSMFCNAMTDDSPLAGTAFEADGAVCLLEAHINGQLDLTAARLESSLSLDLERADIGGNLGLRFADPPARRVDLVDLRGARFGGIRDSEKTWPVTLRLRGCVYASVQAVEDVESVGAADNVERAPGVAPVRTWYQRLANVLRVRLRTPPDVQRRLRWIYRAEQGQGPDAGYTPQPYMQLSAMYRQEGREGDARRVAYERERRRRGQLDWLGKAWSLFLQWTVGYGYKPLRALFWLVILVIAGTLLFSSFHSAGELRAVTDQHPRFLALGYTMDRLIPVVSFGFRDAFAASGAAQYWALAYTLLGWALIIAIASGLTAAVRRD
jgi:uncharacterized protein YjbI with pentapeptide repeats